MNSTPALRPLAPGYRLPPTDSRLPTPDLRPPASAARASRGSAFTLIELLVATGITALLILGMTGIFDQAMKAWRLASRRGDAEREVRAALTMIQRDFSSLVIQTNLPIYRITNAANNNFIGPSRSPNYSGSIATFFLTLVNPSGQAGDSGDLCGVGYYVAWDTVTRSYNLYRYLRTSSQLLPGLTNFIASAAPITTRTGLFLNTSSPDELVGANVVNFRAEYKTLPALFGNVTSQDGPVITTRPGYVQLELTAFASEAARTFTSSNQWMASTNIQRMARTYLWRIDL